MTFTPEVYEQIRAGAKRSAKRIVPLVYDLIRPESVVDVGGGEGWFAREFAVLGCSPVFVLDESAQQVAEERDGVWFYRLDLETTTIDRLLQEDGRQRFELAVCLEVAEHLPAARAEWLVGTLCASAPVVLFSAAIPGQGGHGHVNEQWPDYWAELFRDRDYAVTAALRTNLWEWAYAVGEDVDPWYAQNLLLCVDLDRLPADESDLSQLFDRLDTWPYRLVHPVIWEHRRQRP